MNFKNINIGALISQKVVEKNIDITRLCKYFKKSEIEIKSMYNQQDLPTDIILKWSKLLEYDFFRLYSQHLILYSPPTKVSQVKKTGANTLPEFRKNIYTKEIINFILEEIENGSKNKRQVIEEYRIPKTTLYKWIEKYRDLPYDDHKNKDLIEKEIKLKA